MLTNATPFAILRTDGKTAKERAMRRNIGPEDLSPQALARISPALTLTKLGEMAVPPLHRAQMSRLRNGHSATPSTWLRVEGAINTAHQYFGVEDQEPRQAGRRRRGAD